MENYLQQLHTMIEKRLTTKPQDSLVDQIKYDQARDLRIVLETIQGLHPDIKIDVDTYKNIKAQIEALDTSTQQHLDAIQSVQTTSRQDIVAALAKHTNIFVSAGQTDTTSSSIASKTVVTRLPGDYIRANKKEFLIYMAGLIRKIYDIKNIQSLKPMSKDFDNKDITLEYSDFTYTKDAKNLFNNIANILDLGNMNLGKVLETIEAADPSGVEVEVVAKTKPRVEKSTPTKEASIPKERISKQFGVFSNIVKDEKKSSEFKQHIIQALQKKLYPETPDQEITPDIIDDDVMDLDIYLDYDNIKFQGTIKSVLAGLAKLVYNNPLNVTKIVCYLLDKPWISKTRGKNNPDIKRDTTPKEEVGQDNDEKTNRILDIMFDPKYAFPADFASRLSEIAAEKPDRFNDYIQKGVTSIKVTLGSMAGKNILDYGSAKLRLYLPGNNMIQDTTIAHFLESIAYIKSGNYDTTLIAAELFPSTNGVQSKVEVKPQPKPQPVETNLGTKTTPIALSHVSKFQETMIQKYSELCISAKKSCNDKEERPQKYTDIMTMLDVIAASIEDIKESINPKNFAAARRTINGYKKMEQVTIASLFGKESNACFMIKEIHEKLTTKDHSKL